MKKVLYILGFLSDSDIDWLANRGKKTFYAKGDHICLEGSNLKEFHIIINGQANVIIGNSIVGIIGKGDIIGEITLIDRKPSSATLKVVEDSNTLSIL